MECQFSEPINIGNASKPDWEYSILKCNENYIFQIQHPTSTAGNFLIKKEYTYGDIVLISLLGVILLIGIFYVLKKLIFHEDKFYIHQEKF